MLYGIEITGPALPRERQAALVSVLVRELGVEPEEAELTVMFMPCVVGPVETVEARDRVLVALAEAGFAARPSAVQAPVPASPPVAASMTVAPPPVAVLAAAPLVADVPVTAEASSNGTAVAVAIVLGVIAAVLGVVVVSGRALPADTVTAAEAAAPPTYAPADGDPVDDIVEGDRMADPSDADYDRYGFSPQRGVNWGAFASGAQTRTAGAPNGTPVPIRDAPSARHGRAVGDVPPGAPVSTDGCLPPRPEDSGRWCRTGDAGGEGWVYDRYLFASAPRPAPPQPSGGIQTARLRDGQFTMTVSEGGQTWRLPRPLSASTSISGIQRRTLAGRDVVQFEARDGRWATTYFWEVRRGLLHFVGQDGSGTTNVSEAPGSRAVVAAALGYVPGDDVVRGPAASSAPSRERAAAPSSYIVLLGSYRRDDDSGLQERLALARQTGLALQVVNAEQ